ncbi:MAG: aspartate-semialdehyde dehydrogenase [Flavobacteriaceae bacterium]|nr:aspartate-semialdehyde dehydrogenase [Flavobacteriaceae bacterium]
MKLAVVGATGLVGTVMLQVLAERKFPFTELLLVASAKSVGKKMTFQGKEYTIVSMEDAVQAQPDIAIFSAGGSTSLEWAPKFAEVGTVVIDNSSAWRMDVTKKLVVPEINATQITAQDKIIANPNCSTIQMVMALHPLHQKYTIKRVVVSTYQSVTGTGVKAVEQLENERKGIEGVKAYPHPIDLNCFPHGGSFEDNGYTTEETKLLNETRKILGADSIQVTATVVRIPTYGGHSEAVNVEFENEFEIADVITLLKEMPGVTVLDNPAQNEYPMPLTAKGKDEVFVGRIRRDFSQPKSLNLWIVSDNLRKGAATNAVQIAEFLVRDFGRK